MQVLRSGGGRLPTRARAYALPVIAAVVAVLTTLDVLAGGLLRQFDDWTFADGLPPRTGAWHFFWRTVVNGGQYWLVGTGAALAAAWAAWQRRGQGTGRAIGLLAACGVWLLGSELLIRAAQVGFARTPPRTGVDELFQSGYLSYPSGHAANAAACWIFILAASGASRRWTVAAHVLILGVAVSVVTLGYHWPTDALAGWAMGAALGGVGRELLARWRGSDERSGH